MSKLTNTQIKNSKGKKKPFTISDGLGLSILINPNGSKWWRFRYQFGGKAKMMSLGTYPDVSLAEARTRLQEVRSKVANAIDPVIKIAEEEDNAETFKSIADQFLKSIVPDVSESHYKRSESLLRLYATPKLGERKISEITYSDVQAILSALSDAGKKESTQKLYAALKALFSYAKGRNNVEVNICNEIEIKDILGKNVIRRKFPTITEPKKIKTLIEGIKNFEGGHFSTKNALLFMAFTSLRSINVRNARWKQINFDTHVMTIAKEEMKIKRSMLHDAKDFVLPLATETMELLESMRPLSGHGKYIFPSIRGDRAMSENAMLVFIRSLGYTKEEFVPHGFRAMFSTIANDKSNFGLELIDAQLAHKVGDKTSQAYNRANYFQKRKDLVQWWADWLDAV